MTETSTPSDVEVKRTAHAQAIRVLVDLHAAYGAGVDLDIVTTGVTVWLFLVPEGAPRSEGFGIGFFDDGAVFDSAEGPEGTNALSCMDRAREYLHRHGHGAR
jgi:hypothetical protein